MTASPTSAPPLRTVGRATRPGVDRVVAVAAVAYSLAWAAGLAITSTGTTVSSSGSAVVEAVADRTSTVALQYVVTELLTGVALLVTLRAVARRVQDRGVAVLAGAVTLLSALQGVLGLWLALVAVPSGDADVAGLLSQAVNRTDGVKMLLLALLAGLGVRAGVRGALPRWLTPVAGLLALSVAASGVGYLFLVDAVAAAAYASLPLLMIWVTAAGLSASRTTSASPGTTGVR
ncbi:hypothetical protein ACFUC1_17585 [Pedococcus sp. NPDC057267]|uniref:hypothetical protein n=1 Tax=Pedococcus sp. NPDC057267 TaxID=3346077 RepID=UPI00363C2825